jgi:hypothetical protein
MGIVGDVDDAGDVGDADHAGGVGVSTVVADKTV